MSSKRTICRDNRQSSWPEPPSGGLQHTTSLLVVLIIQNSIGFFVCEAMERGDESVREGLGVQKSKDVNGEGI